MTKHAPRVTRFDVSAQLIADMLIPHTGLSVKSTRAINRHGFGDVIAFEVEHECVDIPAGFVSLSYRQVTAIGGDRVSIFHAADSCAEPTYQRAPYETPKLEATYKARELLELFKACTPEERACVLDYLDADPRPRPARTHPVDVMLDYIKATGAELAPDAETKFAEMRAYMDEPVSVSPVQIVEPLTEEQTKLVAAIVEDGIAYARRFFGDVPVLVPIPDGGAFTVVERLGTGLMGENGPEVIFPSERAYTFTHDAAQAVRIARGMNLRRDGRCQSCGTGDEEHAKDCAIFEWSVGDTPEPTKLEIVATDDDLAAVEACAHRFVRAGLDVDGPIVKCADCGETIKRAGVLVFGTAGDPIDDAAVAIAIGKTFGG